MPSWYASNLETAVAFRATLGLGLHRWKLTQPFDSRHVFIKPVAEMFNLRDDAASISSRACNGSAFYWTIASIPPAFAIAARLAYLQPWISA